MAIPAVTYDFNSSLQILRDWVVDPSTGGFDTASCRVDFKGEIAGFRTAFARGSAAPNEAGTTMYYAGAQIEDQSGGWITATLFAKGFATTPGSSGVSGGGGGSEASSGNVQFLSYTRQDKLWPYGDSTLFYLSGKEFGQQTVLNPFNSLAPFRIREIFVRGALTRITHQIGGNGDPPARTNLPDRPDGLPQQIASVSNTNPNPLISKQSGWYQTNCTPQVERLGPLVLRTWQETFEWVDKYSDE